MADLSTDEYELEARSSAGESLVLRLVRRSRMTVKVILEVNSRLGEDAYLHSMGL